jgi:hypothetical protein
MLVTKQELKVLSSPACSPQYEMTIPKGTRCEIVGDSAVVKDTGKVIGGNAHDLEHYYIWLRSDDVEEQRSWKWEMLDHGNWTTNALRFATKEEAEQYGRDLHWRWTAMPKPARATESDDQVTHHWNDVERKLTDLERGTEHVPPLRVKLGA